MWELFLDIVFPRTCLSCGKFGSFLCNSCKEKVVLYQQQLCPYCKQHSTHGLTHSHCQKKLGLDGLFVWANYSGPIPLVIKTIKYDGVYGAIGEIASAMAETYSNQFQFDFLVPVPLSKDRERERGFNQAEKLAFKIAQELERSYLPRHFPVATILKRTRNTLPQFDLGLKERVTNLTGAFAVERRGESLSHYSFCVVDDVATTGTTLFECAKVLKQAGARRVYGMAIARGG